MLGFIDGFGVGTELHCAEKTSTISKLRRQSHLGFIEGKADTTTEGETDNATDGTDEGASDVSSAAAISNTISSTSMYGVLYELFEQGFTVEDSP